MWIFMAVLSAFFAGITAVLAKCGIKKTDSDFATALRTGVVLLFSWIMVLIAGSQNTLTHISPKSLLFLILSGLATGGSWLCYFKALSLGDVNKVAPIDKSSTILSVLIAMICFSETDHLVFKLTGTTLLAIGIFLMTEKKDVTTESQTHNNWFIYAVGSAIFAALTSILAKIGISNIESNLGTAIRTAVVLIMAWAVVFAKGKQKQCKHLETSEIIFIILSGIATGASWLCYYYAIQKGIVSVVVPIDKMSILVTVAFSYFFLKETLSKKAIAGLGLMLIGTLIMAIWH
ncbi:EamA family transporter [Ructibacterium gallinarum]|uniref:EamA family transporter n=1 Tax=Ructibacterium gallinarum TaxID=2779355 RepID=A0A9D5LXT9_9FIRM|nr:EamA family transporter [Ructibacterium gallinarum]MBE5039916.1 EamA family transporter [Ructibacterium gallinarum]